MANKDYSESFLEKCDSVKEAMCLRTSNQIKEILEARHMPIDEISRMTGINTSRMKDFLKGYEPMPVWAIVRCAGALGMDISIHLTEKRKK